MIIAILAMIRLQLPVVLVSGNPKRLDQYFPAHPRSNDGAIGATTCRKRVSSALSSSIVSAENLTVGAFFHGQLPGPTAETIIRQY
jgi:hypothetical protein